MPTATLPAGVDTVLYVNHTDDRSAIELFYSRLHPVAKGDGIGVFRSESRDNLQTWSQPQLVINGSVSAASTAHYDGTPWFVNCQNMGRRWDTGEYLALVFGGEAASFPGTPFTSHGALGFVLRSSDGVNWTCDGGHADGSCALANPTTIDHDDGSVTWTGDRWVNAQIVMQTLNLSTLPSGLTLHDNAGGARRRVGFRTSVDGRNWSCCPSYLAGGNPFCPGNITDASPVVQPHPSLDPPELQHYRCRPFRYGDRWVAAVYNYAPSPMCRQNVSGCHGPHMGTSWWVNHGERYNSSSWLQPYRWQRFWRENRVVPPHTILNHAPLPLPERDTLAWVSGERWWGVPMWRVAGLYSPANSQFVTKVVSVPEPPSALAINADALWQVNASDCDSLQELCQSFVMVSVLDPGTNAVVPGFHDSNCVVRGVDARGQVLVWQQGNGSSIDSRALAGRAVRLRITMRDAIVYGLEAAPAS